MAKLVKFKADHLENFEEFVPLNGLSIMENVNEKQLRLLETLPHSYSIISEGKTIACAGVIEFWPGRADSWTMFDKNIDHMQFLKVFRIVKKFLAECPIKRIEATIQLDFKQGHRWIRDLGFIIEAPLLRNYGRKGEDYTLYARIKP